jgi:hypothetical protein
VACPFSQYQPLTADLASQTNRAEKQMMFAVVLMVHQ